MKFFNRVKVSRIIGRKKEVDALKRKGKRRKKKNTQVRRGGHPYPHYPEYLMDLP